MNTFYTNISAIVNKALKKMGYQIVRRNSLERLIQTEATVPSAIADIENRITNLETHANAKTIDNLIRYTMKAHWRTIDLIETIARDDKPKHCQLCGYQDNVDAFEPFEANCIFSGGRLLRHRCPSCEVIFGPQKYFKLDEEMLNLEYSNLYKIYSEFDSTASTIRTFHLLKPSSEGIYLDFGCGGEWSEAISQLRQLGWNIYGFEPSANNSSEFVFSTWEEVEKMQFDGIFSHNLLEHLLDPAGITKRLAKLLKSEGKIVHATACFEYAYEFSRFHVFFFTGRSPEKLAALANMKIVDWVRDGEYIACTLQANKS